jgi:hypothetical protein
MVSENALRDAGGSGAANAVMASIFSSLKSTRGGIMKYPLSTQVPLKFTPDRPVFSLSTPITLAVQSVDGTFSRFPNLDHSSHCEHGRQPWLPRSAGGHFGHFAHFDHPSR